MRQFVEDAGPLAHPVQPQSYITIDNFYTATVYEKGSEVIGMLQDAGRARKAIARRPISISSAMTARPRPSRTG